MQSKMWRYASVLALAITPFLSTRVWAVDDNDDQDPAIPNGLPAAVWEAATYHVPDLNVDDVSLRQVKGHPLVYVIDGESCDRDVVLAIEENGDVREIRFHKRIDGVSRHPKIVHSPEELPDVVKETAERVIPDIDITEVKSSGKDGEQRIFYITGMVMEDDTWRHVTLRIEDDGDLLEARVFKPIKEVAALEPAFEVPEALPEQRDPDDD